MSRISHDIPCSLWIIECHIKRFIDITNVLKKQMSVSMSMIIGIQSITSTHCSQGKNSRGIHISCWKTRHTLFFVGLGLINDNIYFTYWFCVESFTFTAGFTFFDEENDQLFRCIDQKWPKPW